MTETKADRAGTATSVSSPQSGGTGRSRYRLVRRARQALRRMRGSLNGRLVTGMVMLVTVLLIALFAPLLATHDPLEIDMLNRLESPSLTHWMGTDENGRDVYSRVIHGSRISILVGFSVVLTTTLLGALIGLTSGYYNTADKILMRFIDAFMSFPSILLAIAVMAALGASPRNVVIALTITYMPLTARVVRGRVLSIREETYIESARALGFGDARIISRYVLPNCLAPLVVQATFVLALAIIAEAGLSFIGAGTPPPTPSWGNILSDGRQFMRQAEWMTIFPGLFIMFSVLSLNIMGDGMRDALDPRLKDQG